MTDRQDQMTTFAATIRSDVLLSLLAHWHRIRGDRSLPARADFDPLDVRFAIGYLSLIEVHRDPLRFYFRLDGTNQVDLFGIDCTHRYLDEAMPADHAAMAAASYAGVVEHGAPRYYLRKIAFHERLIDYEVVILPFSNDGEKVDLLITGIVPDQSFQRTNVAW
ncbi:MAG: PAS domain-containing protein [Dongiaceae bacterium]